METEYTTLYTITVLCWFGEQDVSALFNFIITNGLSTYTSPCAYCYHGNHSVRMSTLDR